MDLNQAISSIEAKLFEEEAKMTTEEAEVLKNNLDNEHARYFYAIGLLMNSSCRYHYILGFRNYDNLQLEALDLLQKGVENDSPIACYLLAEVKCGLFGKFPMDSVEAKKLYEKYCSLIKDEKLEEIVLNNWDNFINDRIKRFENLRFIEQYKAVNPRNVDTSGHDDAYYESLTDKEKNKN